MYRSIFFLKSLLFSVLYENNIRAPLDDLYVYILYK